MNKNLKRKKYETKDEFYTTVETAERLLVKVKPEHLAGKTIYCNCDGPESEIYKLLKKRFSYYNLKRLIATKYVKDGNGINTVFDGVNETIEQLDGDGSYDSKECESILKRSDCVITNPPFSKLNHFIPFILERTKDIIVIINMMSLMHKDILPYAMSGRLFFTCRFTGGATFYRPNGDIAHVPAAAITTIEDAFSGFRWKMYTTQQLQDNGKFIYADGTQIPEFKFIRDIPIDYEGEMYVPLSILCNPILRKFYDVIRMVDERVTVNSKSRFYRFAIKRKPNTTTEDILKMKGTIYVKA